MSERKGPEMAIDNASQTDWRSGYDAATEYVNRAYGLGLEHGDRAAHSINLRDEFAMVALCGLLASPFMHGKFNGATAEEEADFFARASYRFADAMLKARKTGVEEPELDVLPESPEPLQEVAKDETR